ncbi:MAG: metallophosphoesterase [Eubacteriales bacterium]|nr:metallophosphoesterase [Eubacteriales bacterium]
MIKYLARTTLTPLLKHIPTDRKWLRPFYQATQLQVKVSPYVSPNLPAAFSGLSLAYAADIHYGSYLSQERALEVVRLITRLQADLILLGGDYGENAQTAEAFFDLIPRFPESTPVLAAIGNHDHMGSGANIARLMAKMCAKGVTPLRNGVWHLKREGRTMAFCAPDDILAGFPDFTPLINGRAPRTSLSSSRTPRTWYRRRSKLACVLTWPFAGIPTEGRLHSGTVASTLPAAMATATGWAGSMKTILTYSSPVVWAPQCCPCVWAQCPKFTASTSRPETA